MPSSGDGAVFSITGNGTRDGSHNIALIDLAGGSRLMSRVEGVETADRAGLFRPAQGVCGGPTEACWGGRPPTASMCQNEVVVDLSA